MKIPFNYLPMQFKKHNKIFNGWKKLIKIADFTLGQQMIEFEKKFAKFIGTKYCISTNSGTDALILSLKSLNIGKTDEVITVCNTFFATAGAIVACGAKPVFVDTDDRYQIDCNKIEKKITKKTKAIMPVHWGGASPIMSKVMKIAKKYNIHVVEDACMGIGSTINKKSPGTFGIVNAFSMHPLKSLNVMGDGGMVVTNNKKIAEWLRKFRNHGMVDRDHIDFWGVNMRLQPLQAVVALEGMKTVRSIIKKRNINARQMDMGLKNLYPKVILPKRLKNYNETFALYMALFKKRDQLLKYLIKNKIEAKIHYPIPLHLQKAARKLGYKKGDFKVAENQAKKLITLPIHQFINGEQIKYVIKTITKFYRLN